VCLVVVGAGPAISEEHVKVEAIGDLHRFGRQKRSTLIPFVKFEVLFNRQEPGYLPGPTRSYGTKVHVNPASEVGSLGLKLCTWAVLVGPNVERDPASDT
jgi:hypothetical protein